MKKFSQKNRSEQEIAGYRAVLQTIHDNYEYIVPTSNVILQLYQELYSFVGNSARYKTQDNQITEIDSEGNERMRFSPTAAFETKESMERLTGNFLAANKKNEIDNLILIPMFILDFLCIHPFDDGNGRMSRLLTLLLYYRSDLVVEKYISLEKLIEESKETYYEVLQESSKYWQEEKTTMSYLLNIIWAYF